MDIFLPTLALTTIALIIAVFFMAIGWLITGKSKMTKGSCGMGKKNDLCDSNCDLCEKKPKKSEVTHE